jgi:NADH dehydrogenase [ubiquinone] 1 alpha subcomplex assembly factor 5
MVTTHEKTNERNADSTSTPLGLIGLPGVLKQIRQGLKPDGFFLGSMIGGDSVFELR